MKCGEIMILNDGVERRGVRCIDDFIVFFRLDFHNFFIVIVLFEIILIIILLTFITAVTIVSISKTALIKHSEYI